MTSFCLVLNMRVSDGDFSEGVRAVLATIPHPVALQGPVGLGGGLPLQVHRDLGVCLHKSEYDNTFKNQRFSQTAKQQQIMFLRA